MSNGTDDVRISQAQPLITPWVLAEELPLPADRAHAISVYRQEIADVLCGSDQRVLAIVGPCSVHDPEALLEFAEGSDSGFCPVLGLVAPRT